MTDILDEIARVRNVGDVDACRELLGRAHRVIYDLRDQARRREEETKTLRETNLKLSGKAEGDYVMMPVEATDAMITAALQITPEAVDLRNNSERHLMRWRYNAMVAKVRYSYADERRRRVA